MIFVCCIAALVCKRCCCSDGNLGDGDGDGITVVKEMVVVGIRGDGDDRVILNRSR